jgi:hypothetical protein
MLIWSALYITFQCLIFIFKHAATIVLFMFNDLNYIESIIVFFIVLVLELILFVLIRITFSCICYKTPSLMRPYIIPIVIGYVSLDISCLYVFQRHLHSIIGKLFNYIFGKII